MCSHQPRAYGESGQCQVLFSEVRHQRLGVEVPWLPGCENSLLEFLIIQIRSFTEADLITFKGPLSCLLPELLVTTAAFY